MSKADTIFFTSIEHKQRFVTTIQQIGKVYEGKLDPEYSAALYLLTADLLTWKKARDYVDRYGIDIPTMLEEVDFSSGHCTLIKLAGNLFNSQTHLEPIELLWLDGRNFRLSLTALQLRRASLHVDDFTLSAPSGKENQPSQFGDSGLAQR